MEAESSRPKDGRRWLRVVLVLVPCIAFLGLLGFGVVKTGSAPGPGEEAPDFEAPLLTGNGALALDDLRGKPVFINFWWSGCEPCKDEAPALRRAHEVYGDEVEFVGVNIRDARTDAIAFAEDQGLDYAHVRDDALDIYREYGLTGQPESFFIDDKGIVVEHIAGPVDEEGLRGILDVLVSRSG